MSRKDGRGSLELRPVSIECAPVPHAEGSCLIQQGLTRVLVTASVENRVPPFLRDTGEGWITAEYGMLPRATHERSPREAAKGKQSGRTLEIQRLVGRALRSVTDRTLFPDTTITLDCDVLVADAGTRCASITGAYVALMLAFCRLAQAGKVSANPLREQVAAISIGVLPAEGRAAGTVALDLDYSEDSSALVDLNLVGTASRRLVEIQGTAEREPFGQEVLLEMLGAGWAGLEGLFSLQRTVLEGRLPASWRI